MLKLLYIFFCLNILTLANLIAEVDTLRPRFGIYSDFNLNFHQAQFTALPLVPTCCPEYKNGSGNGFNIGLSIESPISKNLLFGLKTGFSTKNVKFSSLQNEIVEVNFLDYPGVFEHKLNTYFSEINLFPQLSLNFYDRLFFNFGIGAGLYIVKNFDQIEEIKEPENTGIFKETGTRQRNPQSGKIIDVAKFNIFTGAGLSYELPLNKTKTVFLCPEINFIYGITNVVNGYKWKSHSLQAGLCVTYSPFERIRIQRQIYETDTISKKSDEIALNNIKIGASFVNKHEQSVLDTIFVIINIKRTDTTLIPLDKPPRTVLPELQPDTNSIAESDIDNINFDSIKSDNIKSDKIKSNKLKVYLKLLGLSQSGMKSPINTFLMKVQITKEVMPLLPYVFFDINSAEIPPRYNKYDGNEKFDITALKHNPLVYHRNILNIIGTRLIENPSSKLILRGFSDMVPEGGNCALANKRANSVKNYIINSFQIDPSRISISENGICTPDDATKSRTEAGYEENRRVEIEAFPQDLLSPVENDKYQKPQLLTPRNIYIEPSSNDDEIKNWQISFFQGKNNLFEKRAQGAFEPAQFRISDEDAQYLETNKPLKAKLVAFSNEGDSASDEIFFRTLIDTAATEAERLTLTLFKVSASKLDKNKKMEIESFIKGLDKTSIINITGYCDILGDSTYNRQLSQIRANEVQKCISEIAPAAIISNCTGIGSDKYPPGVYSYRTPEERFICRTTEIEIKKPLKK